MTGDPAGSHSVVTPAESSKARLGMLLFFNKALSLDYETACVTCHHPKFATGDDLSLPIGVAASYINVLGPARKMRTDLGPLADGAPNMPATPPIINSVLYESSMFWDGRIFVSGTDSEGGSWRSKRRIAGTVWILMRGQVCCAHKRASQLQTRTRCVITGISAGDIDADGYPDLYLAHWGQEVCRARRRHCLKTRLLRILIPWMLPGASVRLMA